MPKNFATALIVLTVEGVCFLCLSNATDRWFFGLAIAISVVGAGVFYLRVK